MAELEQAGNLSCLIYINTLCCRNFRKTRHSHDLSGKSYYKPAEIFRFLTVTSKSVGAPSFVWSSVKLY